MNLIPQFLKNLYTNDAGTVICGIIAVIAFIYHIVNISYSYCNTSIALCKTPIIAKTATSKNINPVSKSKESLVLDIKCDRIPAGDLDSSKTSKYVLGTYLIVFAVGVIIATVMEKGVFGNDSMLYYVSAGLLLLFGIINLVVNIGGVKVTGMIIAFILFMQIIYDTIYVTTKGKALFATGTNKFIGKDGIVNSANALAVIVLVILAGAFAFNLYTFTAGYIEYGLANMVNIIVILIVAVASSQQLQIIWNTYKGPNKTGISYMIAIFVVLLALFGHMIYMLYHCKFQTYDCEPEINVYGSSVHIHCNANI
jgi:hypothetical protein